MEKVKIMRATVNGIAIYMHDETLGKAKVAMSSFTAYLEALDTVALFEQEVDRQYEQSKS